MCQWKNVFFLEVYRLQHTEEVAEKVYHLTEISVCFAMMDGNLRDDLK